MEANPSVTLTEDPQWLHPIQLGTSTILRLAEAPETLVAVQAVLDRLAPDPYVEFMRRYYALGRERYGSGWGYADQITVLHAAARLTRPRRYLEIGVFRGRSLAVVASAAPDCELFAFDLWVEGYAGLENVGPNLVRSQLERVGHRGQVQFVSGSSHETVPAFLAEHPDLTFDMVTVDGDHTEAGARRDLEVVLPRVCVGGVLVFDDICHPKHPWLERVWAEVVGAHPGFRSLVYTEVGHGVAFGIRRDPDVPWLEDLHGDASERLRALGAALEELRCSKDEELRSKLAEREAYLQHVEEDRAKRLEVIERQGAEQAVLVERLTRLEAQAARARMRADQARDLVRQTLAGVLTPGKARRTAQMLDELAAGLSDGRSEPSA